MPPCRPGAEQKAGAQERGDPCARCSGTSLPFHATDACQHTHPCWQELRHGLPVAKMSHRGTRAWHGGPGPGAAACLQGVDDHQPPPEALQAQAPLEGQEGGQRDAAAPVAAGEWSRTGC